MLSSYLKVSKRALCLGRMPSGPVMHVLLQTACRSVPASYGLEGNGPNPVAILPSQLWSSGRPFTDMVAFPQRSSVLSTKRVVGYAEKENSVIWHIESEAYARVPMHLPFLMRNQHRKPETEDTHHRALWIIETMRLVSNPIGHWGEFGQPHSYLATGALFRRMQSHLWSMEGWVKRER